MKFIFVIYSEILITKIRQIFKILQALSFELFQLSFMFLPLTIKVNNKNSLVRWLSRKRCTLHMPDDLSVVLELM